MRKLCPSAKIHPTTWIEFCDNGGRGYAQPDLFIVTEGRIYLFESKLTQTHVAHLQMEQLYAPLLEHIYKRPVVCVQVCKNLVSAAEQRVRSLHEVFSLPAPGNGTWLWL